MLPFDGGGKRQVRTIRPSADWQSLLRTGASRAARLRVWLSRGGIAGLRPISASLVVRCDTGFEAWHQWKAELARLNNASASPSPFATLDFLETYATHSEYYPHDAGRELRLFTVWEAATLIGYVAMRRTIDQIAGFEAPRLDFLATHDVERPGIVARPGDLDRVTRALLRHLLVDRDDWTMVEFMGQDQTSVVRRIAPRARGAGVLVREIANRPYNEVPITWSDLGGYFKALSKRMRSNVSRQARRLFESGDVSLVVAEGPGVAALFPAYLDLEQRSWKWDSAAAMQRHPERIAFFDALVNGGAGMEPSLVGIARDGVLIAALINGRFADGQWALEMAFDESYAELGPGQLLLLVSTGQAIDAGCRRYNFLQAYSYFKQRWLAEQVEIVNVQVIRRPSLHHAKATAGDARRRWKRYQARRQHGDDRADQGDELENEERLANSGPRSLDTGTLDRCRATFATALAVAPQHIAVLDRAQAQQIIPFALS